MIGTFILLAIHMTATTPVGGAIGPADSPVAAAVEPDSATAESVDPEIRDLMARINRQRASAGCKPLVWDRALAHEARRHSRDMAGRGYFDHVNPAGANPFDRLRRAGITFERAAENLAAGQHTGEQVFHSWMSTPGHRANLVNCRFVRAGVGRAGALWTLLLLRPKE